MGARASIDEKLKVVYEDSDIIVVVAPHEDELEKIVLDILREHGDKLSVKEIHKYLEAIASEEKIRKTLYRLVSKGKVESNSDGKYKLIENV